MAYISIKYDDGKEYSSFKIYPKNGWGPQLEEKLRDIIEDLQAVLEEESNASSSFSTKRSWRRRR